MPAAAFFRKLGLFVRTDFLDPARCARLVSEISASESTKGVIVKDLDDGLVDETLRSVLCASVGNVTVQFVRNLLVTVQPELEKHFGVLLTGCERPNFLTYGKESFFKPHRDVTPDSPASINKRRVSVVAFLNKSSAEPAPGCYGGGALTFYGLMNQPHWEQCAFSLDAEPGLLIAFRSDTLHEVQPVTFGQRFTIASWFVTDEDAAD